MFESVYQWLLDILQFALDTFSNILEATGTTSFYISGFFICLAVSAFFLPLVHKGFNMFSVGSDKAGKVPSGKQYQKNSGYQGKYLKSGKK